MCEDGFTASQLYQIARLGTPELTDESMLKLFWKEHSPAFLYAARYGRYSVNVLISAPLRGVLPRLGELLKARGFSIAPCLEDFTLKFHWSLN